MFEIGDPAPDFSLMSLEGKRISLTELRGHKVLIWFYPEADTPG
jgi:peroxiredoxin Q/BCP